MPRTMPRADEFTIIINGVRHDPTGAEFVGYGGSHLGTLLKRALGSALPDGRDYDPLEVGILARDVWLKHLQKTLR